MKLRVVGPILFSLFCASVALGADTNWKFLFNGKDLSGWETYLSLPLPSSEVPGAERDAKGNYTKLLGVGNDPLKCFSVVEVEGKPAIRLSGEGFGTLATLESFSNYHLRLQFKWGVKKWIPGSEGRPRGSGLLYHGHGNHGDGDVDKRWMHHQQFQVQEGNCGDYVAVGDSAAEVTARKVDEKRIIYDDKAALVTVSARAPNPPRCAKSSDFEKPSGEWNTLDLICVGDKAIQVMNGHVVMRLAHSEKVKKDGVEPLVSGRILLQMEGSEIFFRQIELQAIDALPAEYD
jgi:hypothetical protein